MNVLTIVSPGLKVLFERVAKPEIMNRPEVLRLSGTAAVVACNHIGWVDSLWVAYAVYPRQVRYMSKQELFNSRVAKWILEQGGSFAVDRELSSRDSIKTALDLLKNGEILLIFSSGTRSDQNISFKRGAATVTLHAGVPLVPAFYQGPNDGDGAQAWCCVPLTRPLQRAGFPMRADAASPPQAAPVRD